MIKFIIYKVTSKSGGDVCKITTGDAVLEFVGDISKVAQNMTAAANSTATERDVDFAELQRDYDELDEYADELEAENQELEYDKSVLAKANCKLANRVVTLGNKLKELETKYAAAKKELDITRELITIREADKRAK